MPLCEGQEHQPSLALPNVKPPSEVLVIRFTGEIFEDYEDYIKTLTSYRQRIWTCKYTGESGLTYEEALASEHKIDHVVQRFPAVYEAAAARIVHHSLEPIDTLVNTITKYLESNYLVGETLVSSSADKTTHDEHKRCTVLEVTPTMPTGEVDYVLGMVPSSNDAHNSSLTSTSTAAAAITTISLPHSRLRRPPDSPFHALDPPCIASWIKTISTADKVTGVPGVDSIRRLLDYFRQKHDLPVDLPLELAERVRPARQKSAAHHAFIDGSVLGDEELAGGDRMDVDADGDDDGKDLYNAEEDEDANEDDDDDDDDEEEWGDDEYTPSRFSIDDLPWRARGRGRGRGRGRPPRGGHSGGVRRGRRGRGRGRWAFRDVPDEDRSLTDGVARTSDGRDVDSIDDSAALRAEDLEILVETVEEVERRMQPGSIKHAILTVLREVGEEGMGVNDLTAEIQIRGLKTWDEPKQARNSIASTCGHDPAFIRVAPGRFALRALLSAETIRQMAPAPATIAASRIQQRIQSTNRTTTDGGVGAPAVIVGGGSTPGDNVLDQGLSRQLAAVEAQQADAMRRLSEHRNKAVVERNNFKCPKCHRVVHPDGSPLMLCDTCPRSYHVTCMGIPWKELPAGNWCCPKCTDATQSALRRIMDLETKKKETLERAASKEKVAEDKLLRRLLNKEDKDCRQSDGSLCGGSGGGMAKEPLTRGPQRRTLDDWDVLEEEKEHMARLEIRVKELDEMSLRAQQRHIGGARAATMQPLHILQQTSMNNRTHNINSSQLAGSSGTVSRQASGFLLPGYSQALLEGGDAVVARAAEAHVALDRLKSIIEGPPKSYPLLFGSASSTQTASAAITKIDQPRAPILTPSADTTTATKADVSMTGSADNDGKECPPLTPAHTALMEAFTVSEFLVLYGGACEVHKELTAAELIAAAKWPLDHAADLHALYSQLILCCLLEQQNRDPPVKGRARRWMRLLSDATWPEVLRRYLLCTRAAASDGDEDEDVVEHKEKRDEDEGVCSVYKNGKAKEDHGAGVLSAEKEEELMRKDPLYLKDRELALYGAVRLARAPWWELPPAAHLCLLGLLCYDIAQGATLREDINTRLHDCIKIQTDWSREQTAVARKRKQSVEGKGAPAKKRGKQQQQQEVVDGAANSAPGGAQTPLDAGDSDDRLRSREAEFEQQMEERAFRTDPLGCDRYLRKYWWLRGSPGYIIVELIDGGAGGVLTSREEVDTLMASLSRRGPKEQELHANLSRCYAKIVESFGGDEVAGAQELNIETVQRRDGALGHNSSDVQTVNGESADKKHPSLAILVSEQVKDAINQVVEKLTAFLTEGQDIGVHIGMEFDTLKHEVKAVQAAVSASDVGRTVAYDSGNASFLSSPQKLCSLLLKLESVFCATGEGLPIDGDNAGIAALLGDDASMLVDIIFPPVEDMDEANEEKKGQDCGDGGGGGDCTMEDEAIGTSNEAQRAPASSKAIKKEDVKHVETDKAPPARVETENDGDGDGDTASGLPPSQQGQQSKLDTNAGNDVQENRPVHHDDDLDDSDAEHAFLREKRMRRPARLWRSKRERATWIKSVCSAWRAPEGPGLSQASYAAFILCDRAGPMFQRYITLAKEHAKWEEMEKERAMKESLNPAADEQPGTQRIERPLMIRTGRIKTQEGPKVILRDMGKDPFPQGRQAIQESIATEDMITSCRWSYQCTVCQLAGDLLCCEHPDGCAVATHVACTGLAFPQGAWICPNHDDEYRKTRVRKRGRVYNHQDIMSDDDEEEDGGGDDGEQDEDDDPSSDEEEDESASDDSGPGRQRGNKRRSGGGRGKAGRGARQVEDGGDEEDEDEVTKSDVDSEATEDGGYAATTSRKRTR